MVQTKPFEEHLKDERTIDEKIKDKSVNIGYLILDIEKEAGLGVTIEDYQALDGIISKAITNTVRRINYTEDEALILLNKIDNVLTENGFTYVENVDVTFYEALKTKKINCYTASLIYLSVGEKLNLHLNMVSAPSHKFIRWQLDYKTYINWECTEHKQLSDNDYIIRKLIHPTAYDNGVYLRSMKKKEALSEVYVNRAKVKLCKGDIEGAMEDLRIAIELYSKNEIAYNNRANIKIEKEEFDGAIADLDEAISLNPSYVFALNNRGALKIINNDYEGAISDLKEALKIKPSFHPIHTNLGLLELTRGDLKAAKQHLEKAIELMPDCPTTRLLLEEVFKAEDDETKA